VECWAGPVLSKSRRIEDRGYRYRVGCWGKRAVDIAVSFVLLIVAAPTLVVIAAAIKLESRGPLFYRATRVGRWGREIAVLKFRKMRVGVTGLPLTVADDQRFTRIGRFLSRTHLDELPQLWNVLRGDMSLVGPRPEDPRFVALYKSDFDEILTVRPGITGWTQLVFAHESELLRGSDPVQTYINDVLPRKVVLDKAYACGGQSLGDWKILLYTPLVAMFSFIVVPASDGSGARLRRRARASDALAPDVSGGPGRRVLLEPSG
jgi:lipopolysaccharide/colanic/teichoic acid biosynthesis glycosyltransferase